MNIKKEKGEIIMYKYFVSFSHITNGKNGFGNIVFETSNKVNDFNNITDMQQWFIDAQKWIESTANIKNVIILNFVLLN